MGKTKREVALASRRINVGIIGLGGMGNTHLRAYSQRSDVRILALSDSHESRLQEGIQTTAKNPGHSHGGADAAAVRPYVQGRLLIEDPDVDLVDICTTTPAHYDLAMAAIKAGKHVLVEKPVGRTLSQTRRLAAAATAAKTGQLVMPAMCMRFCPGWPWLKTALGEQRYGRLLSVNFRRMGSVPGPGSFYLDGQASGGAILDLHIHDVDFILWCFGLPEWVSSAGYNGPSGQIDHVITRYGIADGPLVVAEASWTLAGGYGFTMQYLAIWERATAAFGMFPEGPLVLMRDGRREVINVEPGTAYDHEIAYVVEQIRRREPPSVVTMSDAVNAFRVVEAEVQSVNKSKRMQVKA